MEKIWFLCFFPVILLHFFMSCFAITPPNITTDQYALLAFKSHITIDLRIVLTHNWSTATSCCSWIGVTCGARHQRVTALNLPNMDLTGTIPPHLGNLSFLASINIRNNSFHGHLPDELVFLHRLRAIHFEYNNFSGEVPFWFGVLPKLQHLLLFNNNFSGSIPSSDMLNMPSLQTLDLDYNSLSGTLPEDLCNQLPKLKNLSLSGNQFYGKIPSGIYKCRQLQHLSLYGNQFLGSIPRELGNLTMLKVLYLGDTNFQLEGVIPVEMGNLISLEELVIRGTSLTGPIPSVIFNISSLKYLEFGNSTLSGTLPEDICDHLPFLKELHLYTNQLTGRIPSNLWRCRELVILNLADNRFTGSIPREIGNLTMMKELIFGENNLKGKIPREIGYLHGLEKLGIELNSLTDFPICSLSVTKWIHLNWGDDGVITLFTKIWRLLQPGGIFVLEPQPWRSYESNRLVSETTAINYRNIMFLPDHFQDLLLDKIGFRTVEDISSSLSGGKSGFSRPISAFQK